MSTDISINFKREACSSWGAAGRGGDRKRLWHRRNTTAIKGALMRRLKEKGCSSCHLQPLSRGTRLRSQRLLRSNNSPQIFPKTLFYVQNKSALHNSCGGERMALTGVWPALSSTVLGEFWVKVGITLTFIFCTLIFCFYITLPLLASNPLSSCSQSRTDRVSMSVRFHPSEKLSCGRYKQRSNHLLRWANTQQPQTARGGYIHADMIRNPESRLFFPELWLIYKATTISQEVWFYFIWLQMESSTCSVSKNCTLPH